MSIFLTGHYRLHSGDESDFKIECDELTDTDMRTIARQLAKRLPPFSEVRGIPSGGLRLAVFMESFKSREPASLLIVDDVLTTGRSMEAEKRRWDHPSTIGAVIWSRSLAVPDWIIPLFQLTIMRNSSPGG